MSAIRLRWRGSRCWTTTTAAGNSAGRLARTRPRAPMPPADAAMATTSKAAPLNGRAMFGRSRSSGSGDRRACWPKRCPPPAHATTPPLLPPFLLCRGFHGGRCRRPWGSRSHLPCIRYACWRAKIPTPVRPRTPATQPFHLKSELLTRTRARIGTMLPAAQKELKQTDLALTLRQSERLYERLQFWQGRAELLGPSEQA